MDIQSIHINNAVCVCFTTKITERNKRILYILLDSSLCGKQFQLQIQNMITMPHNFLRSTEYNTLYARYKVK